MKDQFLRITDLVTLNIVDAVKAKDNLTGLPTPLVNSKGLFVRLAATHAGIVNRNNMFYLPDRMKAGAHTFVNPFQKPVLVNHADDSSPVGRIIAANYIDTSAFVKDKYRGKTIRDMVITDELFDSFCNGTMTYGAQIDFVRNYLNDSILEDPEYQGLGYIEVTAHITDKEAIEKFLDGRYLTSSVGAGTNRASCNICRQDWSKDGLCDHRPGKKYENVKCYMIAGDFEYDELSMVNKPADRHAKVLELNFGAVRDSVRVEDIEFSGKLYEVRVSFPKEEEVMTVKDNETTTETQVVTPPETEQKIEESFDDFMTRVLDFEKGDLSDADDEKLYQLMLDEMKESKLFEDKVIEDAKLSAEKRKGMAKSSFCGPNRSFPVPDCAHVTAARRLIGRYKGPGSKDSILACVSRKASAMGCGAEDSAQTTETVTTNDNAQKARIMHQLLSVIEENSYHHVDMEPALSEDDLDSVRTLLKKLAAVVGKDNFTNAASLEKLALAKTEASLLDEIVSLETKMGALREDLKKVTDSQVALRQEYEIVTKEAEVLQDEVVKTKALLRDSKVKNLTLYKSLKTGTLVDTVDSSLADATLDSELETLTKEVDIKKITDKLNDGTSRKPTGTVENPSGVQDNTIVDAETLKGKLKEIQARYYVLKFQNSILADKYLKEEMAILRAQGLLPKDGE